MTPDTNWPDLLKRPAVGDHLVQLYQEDSFLADAVAQYIAAGLRGGEAAILICTPSHEKLFMDALADAGAEPEDARASGQLRFLDAAATLALIMRDGMPQWHGFRQAAGGALAELRCQYPAVRAYGEMVDLLWRAGKRDAAIRLEEFWNELAHVQTFSLLCAYYMDNLDASAYNGPLECVCKVHSHLIPSRNYEAFNQAVSAASKEVLDQPLARMLQSMSSTHRSSTQMPRGQATLLWLKKNMPRTADRVLDRVRAKLP